MSIFQNHFVWRKIAVTIAIGHVVLICLTSFDIWNNITIVYWQRITSLLLHLRTLTFVLLPITLWFSTERKRHIWATILMIIGTLALLSYINFVSVLASNFTRHVGTVRFDNNIYQLASVEKFDTVTKYYLGECGTLGFICRFQLVYNKDVFADPKLIPVLEVAADKQALTIKFDGELVYSFDGKSETCKISEDGFCPYKLIEE